MDELDDLFAQSRARAQPPSDAVIARVLADAARLQPQPARRGARPGFDWIWAGLAQLFGGRAALAGIGSAALAGLFFGFVEPAALSNVTGGLVASDTQDTLDVMPGFDALLAQE